MRGERRDRSRAAVIIKQKTMVDADNKEGVRAPMRPRRSVERGRRYGERDGARRERTGTPAREAISAKEAAGAKDVVPRTAIDLIRALPDSFSSGRSLPPLPPSSRCDVLLQHCPRFPPGLPPPIPFPRGFLI